MSVVVAPVVVDGKHLSLDDVEAVAVRGAPVRVTDEALDAVAAARAAVERQYALGTPIYGVTTGFGRMADVLVAPSETAIEYALALQCPRVHAMSGLIPAGASESDLKRVYRRNLKHASERCAERKLEVVIEPINRRDIPGYYLNTTAQALETIDAVGAPNLGLQLDLYHTQITEGDLVHHVRDLAGRYTHVQIAGNPDRNEPDHGEVNYSYVLDVLDQTGYDGWVGCEYRPRAGTKDGLSWARPYGVRA